MHSNWLRRSLLILMELYLWVHSILMRWLVILIILRLLMWRNWNASFAVLRICWTPLRIVVFKLWSRRKVLLDMLAILSLLVTILLLMKSRRRLLLVLLRCISPLIRIVRTRGRMVESPSLIQGRLMIIIVHRNCLASWTETSLTSRLVMITTRMLKLIKTLITYSASTNMAHWALITVVWERWWWSSWELTTINFNR